ncbi:MAG: PH domain-containing protein [Sarcina sp.]
MKAKNNPQVKKFSSIIIIVVIIFSVGLLVYFYVGSKNPVTINISNETVTLDGLSNTQTIINLKDITGVEYVTQKLDVTGHVMGGTMGNKAFGGDVVNNFGQVYCYVENLQAPSLLIKTKGENYLVNTSNEQEIKNDYNKLKESIS